MAKSEKLYRPDAEQLERFFFLVRSMRETQKNYFKTRDNIILMAAKDIEKRVDAVISGKKLTAELNIEKEVEQLSFDDFFKGM